MIFNTGQKVNFWLKTDPKGGISKKLWEKISLQAFILKKDLEAECRAKLSKGSKFF